MKLYPVPVNTRWSNYSDDIHSWMIRNSLRYLWEAQKADQPLPDAVALGDWLSGIARSKDVRMDHGTLWKTIESAAIFALAEYDPTYHARMASLGARGGRRSRRGPSFTTDQLRALEGLSIAEQAKALGCTERTVSRARARLKREEDPDLVALDSIQFPETHVPVSWIEEFDYDRHRAEFEAERAAQIDPVVFLAGILT